MQVNAKGRVVSAYVAVVFLLTATLVAACVQGLSSNRSDRSAVTALGFDVNDVSILYPLPTTGDRDHLLQLSTQGAKGILLPETTLGGGLPPINSGGFMSGGPPPPPVPLPPGTNPNSEIYDNVRIVSARIDPCFPIPNPPGPVTCQKQLRLIGQIITGSATDPTAPTSATDGAVHLFYELADTEFSSLVADLATLKAMSSRTTNGLPLGPHPALVDEGLTGPFATTLRQTLLKYIGQQNLVRIAVLGSFGPPSPPAGSPFNTSWGFSANILDGNASQPFQIPNVGGNFEALSLNVDTQGDRTFLAQDPSALASLSPLLTTQSIQAATVDSINQAIDATYSIENPNLRSVNDTDCASCHLTTRVRQFANELRGNTGASTANAYASSTGLTLTHVDTVGDTANVIRNFGYLGMQTAISQRTINESALVAQELNQGN